jgi:hypothetical protein
LSLQRGTSLREDYVFFLLQASLRLTKQRGALAFITSATLLDAFAHAPVRQALLSRMTLREVGVLPRGTFVGTRVEPAMTVWTTSGTKQTRVEAPAFNLRPTSKRAAALDAKWKKRGIALTDLIPVTFAGLKTRFDELLVDDDRRRLERRVRAFLSTSKLERFAREFELQGFEKKLTSLRAFSAGAKFDRHAVRPFLRYRGPNQRGPTAWCYVDRQLIPRGDHRLRADFDPHCENLKLVFNLHELPLAAHVIDEPGCVTMYRHSRFAPALVPRGLLENFHATRFDAADLVPNLSPRALRLGSPRDVFEHVAKHLMSPEFQQLWAPAFGTSRVPVIPL